MKKTKLNRLPERYLATLRIYFEKGPPVDLEAASRLGTDAVALGLETLEMARVHDQALIALIPPDCSSAVRNDLTTSAANFFTEAIAPIEKTHRLAVKTNADMNQLSATLARHTLDLADSKKELQRGMTRRKAAGKALKKSGVVSAVLLAESRELQKRLQEMARRILSEQESERRTMSLKLQGEIAQTLLGIQIRLLALKREVSLSDEDFKKEIAITQRLIESSVQTINRFASEFGIPHEN